MVSAFSELGALRDHAVDTEKRSAEEVLSIVERGLVEGRFGLGW